MKIGHDASSSSPPPPPITTPVKESLAAGSGGEAAHEPSGRLLEGRHLLVDAAEILLDLADLAHHRLGVRTDRGDGRRHGVGRQRGLVDGGGDHGHGLRLYRSEEHTSELQSLMRTSYAVF